MKNNINKRKKLIFTVIALIIMVLFVEFGLRLIEKSIKYAKSTSTSEGRHDVDAFRGNKWSKKLFSEYDEAFKHSYEQYIGWSMKEYQGQYVNINASGVRETWNKPNKNNKYDGNIYFFGGSTLLGEGARDEFTIPSNFSKYLVEDGKHYYVYNHGKGSYTFTQEIIQLIMLLRENTVIPDYVIFYDGVNDVNSAFTEGKAGRNSGFTSMKNQLENYSSENNVSGSGLFKMFWKYLNNISYIFRSTSIVYNYIFSPTKNMNSTNDKYKDKDIEILSQSIKKYYYDSAKLLEMLSKSYGFEYMLFWQPNAFTDQNLTSGEIILTDIVKGKEIGLDKLHLKTLNLMRDIKLKNFYEISDTEYAREKSIYFDHCHMNEVGQMMVSKIIYEIFKNKYL